MKKNKTKEFNPIKVKLNDIQSNIAYFDNYYSNLKTNGIDIIIPIYSGVDETRECIQSVIESTSFPYRILAINDCSPELEMYDMLQEFVSNPHFTLITNKENLGFVKTVNNGFSFTKGDVVLLNSDTKVFPGWLESLARAASWDKSTATVTPYLSNAGIFTALTGKRTQIYSYQQLAHAANVLFDGSYKTILTGHGSCMYIKREVINTVGKFDEEHFGKGYLEETDFCLRCTQHGYNNILDSGCYIMHIGSLSFGQQQKNELIAEHNKYFSKKYPNYYKSLEIWKSDSDWKTKKNTLEKRVVTYLAHNSFLSLTKKKRLLIVMQKSGGGSINNRIDFINAISSKYDCFMLTGDWNNLYLEQVVNGKRILLRQYILEVPLNFNELERSDIRLIYAEILRKYQIDVVNMSHILCQTFDIATECKILNIPIYYVLHDYYTICPTISLLNSNNVCCNGVCSTQINPCPLDENWIKNNKEPINKNIFSWRKNMEKYLNLIDVICAPSNYTKNVFCNIYPSLSKKTHVIEHGRDFSENWIQETHYPGSNEKIKILVLGKIGRIKGIDSLLQLAKLCKNQNIEIHIIGYIYTNSKLRKLNNIIVHGLYTRDNLPDLIREIQPHYGFIPSIFPETYCHTLTELWASKLPTIVYDVGVLAERMKKWQGGWIVPAGDANAIYELITKNISKKDYYQKVKNIERISFPTTLDMATQYLDLINDITNSTNKFNLPNSDKFDNFSNNNISEFNYVINKFPPPVKKSKKKSKATVKKLKSSKKIKNSKKVNFYFKKFFRKVKKMFKFKKQNSEISKNNNTVSIIVCIHNALEDVKKCLQSLLNTKTFPYELILIDDKSDNKTRKYLKEFSKNNNVNLIRNKKNLGYTVSVNKGLRKAKNSDFVIILNSDTIVTSGWIEKMIDAFEKNPTIGILSPLSNAATYQNIPSLKGNLGNRINSLPEWLNPEATNKAVENSGSPVYPQLDCVNGFCFMMRKDVIDKVGDFDEKNFPIGYGEEVDYCIRANKLGYTCNVLDNTYIYHAKTKSFTSEIRAKLCENGANALLNKHGQIYANLRKNMDNTSEMDKIREKINISISNMQDKIKFLSRKRIAVLLPAFGASGGANSICQEVMGMRNLGLNVTIVNKTKYKNVFLRNYPECEPNTIWYKETPIEYSFNFDIIICSIFHSVEEAKKMLDINPKLKIAYYVQDYEPYFFPNDELNYKKALASYELIPDAMLFAKTDWIINTVKKFHPNVNIQHVKPSLKWKNYNPYLINKINITYPIHIVGMVRPSTPRRNPKETIEVMHRLTQKFKDKVIIHTFGSNPEELAEYSEFLDKTMIHHGIIKSWKVAQLLYKCTIFIDMSNYQAFGRTGLEAMALGCTSIMPEKGGTKEFGLNNENCILIDTQNIENAINEASTLIENPEKLKQLCLNGINTAKRYNVYNAVNSEIDIFYNWLKNIK